MTSRGAPVPAVDLRAVPLLVLVHVARLSVRRYRVIGPTGTYLINIPRKLVCADCRAWEPVRACRHQWPAILPRLLPSCRPGQALAIVRPAPGASQP